MADNKFKQLLQSGALPAYIACGSSVLAFVCVILIHRVGDGNSAVFLVLRIIGQLTGYGAFGFGGVALFGAFKSERPFLNAGLGLFSVLCGMLGISGAGM